MLSKTTVLDSIQKMPDQFTLEELIERLIFLEKIENGLAQAKEGKVIPDKIITEAWQAELRAREEALENGTSVGRPARDVIAKFLKELKKKFGKSAEVEIRAKEGAEVPTLSDDLFWKIIDSFDWSKKTGSDVLALGVEKLAEQETVFIYLFADALHEKLAQLNTKVHAKAFAEKQKGKFSADDFLYARCGVIAEGQDCFKKILKTPSEIPTDIIFEALLNLPSKAYNLKTGKDFNYNPQ